MAEVTLRNRQRLTPYEQWMFDEGIPIVEGHGVEDVKELPRGHWRRLGGRGTFIHLYGMEGYTGMYIAEIPPGEALQPEKHMYEELIFILRGRGSTEVKWEGEQPQHFEWEAGSVFSPPLNTSHRLYNGTNEPALFLALTNAPLMMDVINNVPFIFNCDYKFTDRYDGRDGYFKVGPREKGRGGLGVHWRSNFLPNVWEAMVDAREEKGAGVAITSFSMAGNALGGHMAEWPVGRYHKAHYHGGGAVLFILRSHGYTLMWPRELGIHPYQDGYGDRLVKVPWREGSVFSPGTAWFHQHFNTGPLQAKQLALRWGSTDHTVGFHSVLTRHEKDYGGYVSVRDGGTMIEYEDEDPQIRKDYDEALRRAAVPCTMPQIQYRK